MALASKIFISLFWAAFIINFVIPFGGTLETGVFWGGIVIGAAHVVEAAIYYPKAKESEGSLGNHMLQFLLFGYMHFITLKPKAEEAA